MAAISRSITLDVFKMLISAGWIAIATLATPSLIAHRTENRVTADIAEHARSIREHVGNSLHSAIAPGDPRFAKVIETEATDPVQTAEVIDRAVKQFGISHVAVLPAAFERCSCEITVELLRRGYREDDLLQLLVAP